MDDLIFFCNDKYKVLNYLYDIEYPEEYRYISKCTQDDLASMFSMGKSTVNRIINELISNGFLDFVDHSGKYSVTKKGHESLRILNSQKNKNKAKLYNCISLFAGVGGIELGFKNIGFPIIYANEYNIKAVQTYENNFDLKVDSRDIRDVSVDIENNENFFKEKKVNILLAGFPCQAFSIAGYQQGFKDAKGRGDLFFEIVKIIHKTTPDVIFLENVKNLKSHDKGRTYKIIEECLENEGYTLCQAILNTMEYGNIPQNRERIYIVAFKDEKKANKFHFPCKLKLTNTINDVIDYSKTVDKKFYYTDNNFLHYDQLKEVMTSKNTVYQWRRVYVRENKTGVCPTLTANMGTGGHNVPLILSDAGIRKLTPRECFALQGFPKDYVLPSNMALSTLYKQAGNSVSVTVIERIARQILRVL